MLWKGAGICPFVIVGDTVHCKRKGRPSKRYTIQYSRTVVDLAYSENIAGTCDAFRCMALVKLKTPVDLERGLSSYIHPVNTGVNCKLCPLLADDPNHRGKTLTHEELRDAQEESASENEVAPSKPASRFDSIDIS